ncbi:hypothetical protein HMN09_01188700 [Mycena chlorophos]|uniref:Uncharacterized protein n=1 Tax=Mycena chlorophos TaxID=658473 RepID=A0A8H6S875_MYCCL|nr:hypothetical protein HMN09_01188700 [Mycena chlorophos]
MCKGDCRCAHFKPPSDGTKVKDNTARAKPQCQHKKKHHAAVPREPEERGQLVKDIIGDWKARATNEVARAETNRGLKSQPKSTGIVSATTEKKGKTKGKTKQKLIQVASAQLLIGGLTDEGKTLRLTSAQQKRARKSGNPGVQTPSNEQFNELVGEGLAILRPSDWLSFDEDASQDDITHVLFNATDGPFAQHSNTSPGAIPTTRDATVLLMHRGPSGKTAAKDCRLHFALKRKIPSHVLADIPRALARLEAGELVPSDSEHEDESEDEPKKRSIRSRRRCVVKEESDESDESESADGPGSEEEVEAEDSGSDEPVVKQDLPEGFNATEDDDSDLAPPTVLGVRQRSESIDEDDDDIVKPKKSRTQSPLFSADDDDSNMLAGEVSSPVPMLGPTSWSFPDVVPSHDGSEFTYDPDLRRPAVPVASSAVAGPSRPRRSATTFPRRRVPRSPTHLDLLPKVRSPWTNESP